MGWVWEIEYIPTNKFSRETVYLKLQHLRSHESENRMKGDAQ